MRLWQSVRCRLTLQWVVVCCVLLGFFGIVVYVGARHWLYRTLDAVLWSIAESAVAAASEASGGVIRFHAVESSPQRPQEVRHLDTFVQLRAFPAGAVVGKSANLGALELPLSPPAQHQLARGEAVLETVQMATAAAIRLISMPIVLQGHTRYVMQVGTSLAPVQDTLAGLVWGLLALSGSALVLTGGAGAWVAYRALRPLDRLGRSIERLACQNLSPRLSVGNPHDEIGRLTCVLNDLLERLEESSRQQQRFIADAAHELRSPLANLQLALEYTLRRLRRPEEYHTTVQNALREVQRLTTLVQDLLTLSRADSGRLDLVLHPIALHELLQQLVAAYQLRAQENAMTLALAMPEVLVKGDAALLQQLFTNLLENALRYTPAYGTVSIAGVCLSTAVCVAVTDTGSGIAPEHLPHLFERFYRVNKDHARGDHGSGLGLAICQEIVRVHGGTLAVQSTPGKGSTFTVTLRLDTGHVP